MRILSVSRAERFSPNSVERDKAIFQAVIDRLQEYDNEVRLVSEENLEDVSEYSEYSEYSESSDLVITMARQPETLMWLKSLGVTCVNSPEGIERCTRSRLLSIMERLGTPVPAQVLSFQVLFDTKDSKRHYINDSIFLHPQAASFPA